MGELTFLVVTDLGELVGYGVGTVYLSAIVSGGNGQTYIESAEVPCLRQRLLEKLSISYPNLALGSGELTPISRFSSRCT
jgi:hypothetical protein